MKSPVRSLTLIMAWMALAAGAWAQQADRSSAESAARRYFTDVVLINQSGEEMRLYSDLIRGKVVLINTFFTSCNGVCPLMSRRLAQVQEWLGDRLGKEVHIISISVDPETDTPPRIDEYARRWGARRGWYFLTGDKENVDQALAKLGQLVENKESHQAVIIVGNEPTGLWKKALGLADAKELIPIVESVLEDPGPAAR